MYKYKDEPMMRASLNTGIPNHAALTSRLNTMQEMTVSSEHSSGSLIRHVLDNNAMPTSTAAMTTHPSAIQNLDGQAVIPSLNPSLPSTVQLSLTITYIVVFGLIFVVVYIQLWMIWYYRHKRLSHQTLFLSLCLIWAGLRTSLFSFYFQNCKEANDLDTPFYWLLYCLPVCLQFSMLCLLLHFYAQVVFKTRARYETAHYKYPLRIFLSLSVLLFLAINLACAILTKQYESKPMATVPLALLYVRVSLNESMFLIYGILMSVCIYKMAKTPASRSILEAKGTTVHKAVIATLLINLLFLSRTVYNLISICPCTMKTPNFGYEWINVTDQADSVEHLGENMGYVSFGVVLFVWEVLPITIVMVLFRVKRLQTGQVFTDFYTQSHGSRVFFFDNPRRYDSEDDLSSHANSGYQRSESTNSISRVTHEDSAYSDRSHWSPSTSIPSQHGAFPSHVSTPSRVPAAAGSVFHPGNINSSVP